MTKHTTKIEGLPEGWEPVAYRRPQRGEHYIERNANVCLAPYDCLDSFLILERIKPRRIVLEETNETRKAKPGEYYEFQGLHFNNNDYETMGAYNIWREVEGE